MSHPVSQVRGHVGPRARQRVAAVGAIAADAAAAVTVVVLVVLQPVYALVMALLVVGFVACSVAALVAAGPRRHVLVLGAFLCALGLPLQVVVWGVVLNRDAFGGPLVLVLLGLGYALGRYALRLPPPEVDLPVELTVDPAATTGDPTPDPSVRPAPDLVRDPVRDPARDPARDAAPAAAPDGAPGAARDAAGDPRGDLPGDRAADRRDGPADDDASGAGRGTRRVTGRAVLLVNPRSGGGKADEFDLAGVASELGVEVVVLGPDDDLGELARAALDDAPEAIGMAGGDGSQAYVLGLAAERDVPFVCVPSGTRNHFALDLGLDRSDPRKALAAFLDGEERRIDYATVNGRVFVNNVALGVYAAIVEQDGYRDAKLQTTLDLLPTLASDGGPWFDLGFDVPGHGHLDGTVLLLVSNNAYDLTGGGQRARLDEGVLGIVTLNPERLADLAAITLFAAAGRADAARSLWIWEAPSFSVTSPHPTISAGVDGETVVLDAPLEFRVVPGGARVLVPRGSRVGLEEQLASTGSRYSGLLEVAFNLPARR